VLAVKEEEARAQDGMARCGGGGEGPGGHIDGGGRGRRLAKAPSPLHAAGSDNGRPPWLGADAGGGVERAAAGWEKMWVEGGCEGVGAGHVHTAGTALPTAE
jgi:hypothetical protein